MKEISFFKKRGVYLMAAIPKRVFIFSRLLFSFSSSLLSQLLASLLPPSPSQFLLGSMGRHRGGVCVCVYARARVNM